MDKLHVQARREPEKKPSLVEDAYRALKDAIRNNVFPPGYQGSEQEIALRLGMSRTPVHEAIIRLQEDGLVLQPGLTSASGALAPVTFSRPLLMAPAPD